MEKRRVFIIRGLKFEPTVIESGKRCFPCTSGHGCILQDAIFVILPGDAVVQVLLTGKAWDVICVKFEVER